jgi:hypothetical protein
VCLWEVFPFDFGGSDVDWVLVTRVVIAVAIAGGIVSIIVQIAVLVRTASRPPIEQESKDARNRRL